jgi:hypothetical protein
MAPIYLLIMCILILAPCDCFRPAQHSSRVSVTSLNLYAADFDASGVRMNRGSTEDFEKEGSTLVTTRSFAKGDILVKIPLAMCILAHRCGVISGTMRGQTDTTFDNGGDLRQALSEEDITQGRTWDINLALALLDATSGGNLAGDFWESYCGVYPLPKDVTVPFTLPLSLLEECQNPTLYRNAVAQQERLSTLFPKLKDTHLHRFTQEYADIQMSPLQWAFAMVRSRCFHLSNTDWFAQVPIIELCNHDLSDRSNAQFEGEVSLNDQGFPLGYVYLRAKGDIAEGTSVTISYDDGGGGGEEEVYSNERLWTQYGFTLDDHLITTKDADLIPWNYLTHEIEREKGGTGGGYKYSASAIVYDGLIDTLVDSVTYLKFNGQEGYAYGSSVLEQVSCALSDRIQSSICVDGDGEVKLGSVTEALSQLRQDVSQVYSVYSTTLEQDIQLYASLNTDNDVEWVTPQGESVAGNGEKMYNRVQYSAVVRYRMDRKKAIEVCLSVLDTALSKLQNKEY